MGCEFSPIGEDRAGMQTLRRSLTTAKSDSPTPPTCRRQNLGRLTVAGVKGRAGLIALGRAGIGRGEYPASVGTAEPGGW